VRPIKPNLLVVAVKGGKCTGKKAAKIRFNVQKWQGRETLLKQSE